MYKEKLTWILDKTDAPVIQKDEELYRQNTDFVHSLGLTCDPVGWCEMWLGGERTEKILSAIEGFCRKNGWRARGYYEMSYENPDAEWFELNTVSFGQDNVADTRIIPCEGGASDTVPDIRAYKETNLSPKKFRLTNCVPARFAAACGEAGVADVRFCRLHDAGKYAAEQYFAIYPRQNVANIGVDWKFRRKADVISPDIREFFPGDDGTMLPFNWKYLPEDSGIVAEMGGYLPRLAELFYDLGIRLPNCYLAKDMPSGGMATAYYFRHKNLVNVSTVLIHKELAGRLLAAKAIAEKHIRPAMVAERLPAGYISVSATEAPRPTEEYMAQNREEYEKFLATPRPVRAVTEKEAQKRLRSAKKERKEDFGKALPKAKAEALAGTACEALAPYYRIANGGLLSDEYELLSYAEALAASAEFEADMQREELLAETPSGIVFAKCPDGDKVLLCAGGKVLRISHEEPTAYGEWSTLAEFIFEAVEETEQ